MSPTENTPTPQKSSLLSRARRLGTGVVLAVATQAVAGPLTLDYSSVGQATNSGWFVSAPDESKADGIILANGFKLWGSGELNDGMFWRPDYYEPHDLVPRSDFTSLAFFFGGKITGGASHDDTLSAPFDFTVAFTNALEGPDQTKSTVNVQLRLGYRKDSLDAPSQYGTVVPYNAWQYDYESWSFNKQGSYHLTGEMSTGLTDSEEDLYWFAVLTVEWSNEFVSSRNWNGGYQSLNGDTLKVIIPQNSIDVTYVPGQPEQPPVNRVPDAGSTFALFGLGLAVLGWMQRRR